MEPTTFDYTTLGDTAGSFPIAETTMDPAMAAGLIAFMGVFWILGLAIYVYMSLCTHLIAKKMKMENPWFAWIPILNFVLMLQMAKRPIWWLILMFIPFVNIVISIIVLVDIMKALGKPSWWVVLMMIPVVNFVVWGILAFKKQ